MIRMFVGDDDGVDGEGIDAGRFEPGKGFAAGKAAIDQQMGLAIADVGRVTGARTGEYEKAKGQEHAIAVKCQSSRIKV